MRISEYWKKWMNKFVNENEWTLKEKKKKKRMKSERELGNTKIEMKEKMN